MAAKDQYVTVAPVTPKGKWLVCARRVGSKDRLAPIAEARSESSADKIVSALNLLQGEVAKADIRDLGVAEELGELLKKERECVRALQRDVSGLTQRLRAEQHTHDDTKGKLRTTERLYQQKCDELNRYRDNNPEPRLAQSAAE